MAVALEEHHGLDGAALAVRDLRVTLGRGQEVVKGISLAVRPGEMLGLVGESGSGKTMALRAVAGLLPVTARPTLSGTVQLAGGDPVDLAVAPIRPSEHRPVGYVFQEPLSALNPGFTVGWQLREALRYAAPGLSRDGRVQRALEVLSQVGLPGGASVMAKYPFELSGGMRQRVVIGLALLSRPRVLLADEPTTALDVSLGAEVLDLLAHLQRSARLATVLVSHDLTLVGSRCARVAVMHDGRIVEQGAADDVFDDPQHPYTRFLLASSVDVFGRPPRASDRSIAGGGERRPVEATPRRGAPAVEVDDVVVRYPVARADRGRSGSRWFSAVDHVSFAIAPGAVHGLVGESGSGKSTLGRAVAGLQSVAHGTVRVEGEQVTVSGGRRSRAERRAVQFVFQDPRSSLNPRMPVGRIIERALVLHTALGRQGRATRIGELLDEVRLPATAARRFPGELSGGQRQRVAIARALAVEPAVLVADEPTSALDVSVQARILALLQQLAQDRALTILFITHDFAAVRAIADSVMVMHLGTIVESGSVDDVVHRPLHPYTRALLSSVPSRSGGARPRARLNGSPLSPLHPPGGCRLHTRCPYARADCATTEQVLRPLRGEHAVLCRYATPVGGPWLDHGAEDGRRPARGEVAGSGGG